MQATGSPTVRPEVSSYTWVGRETKVLWRPGRRGGCLGDTGVVLKWSVCVSEGGRVEGGHLDGGHVALEADNLADELGVAHAHELVHRSAGHLVGDHDRTRDGVDTTDANHLSEAWWVSDLEGGGGLGWHV